MSRGPQMCRGSCIEGQASMDWLAPVDAYCERIAPGLLGEPLNALSNISFFLAAFFVLRSFLLEQLEFFEDAQSREHNSVFEPVLDQG